LRLGKLIEFYFVKRLNLKIHGRVLGVFFRQTTETKARGLGLVGWVKNAPDGTVEVVAEGEEGALKKLLEFCEKGTEFSSVTKVEEKWAEVGGVSLGRFEICY